MRFVIVFLLVVISGFTTFSQNLILNPDFGKVSVLYDKGKSVLPWNWFALNGSFPQFFHPEKDYSGSFIRKNSIDTAGGMVGLRLLHPTQAIFTRLQSNLLKNQSYKLDLLVKFSPNELARQTGQGADKVSQKPINLIVSFAKKSPNCDSNFRKSSYILNFPPKIANEKWMTVSTNFRASGGENYLIIGGCSDQNYIELLKILGKDSSDFSGQNAYFIIKNVNLEACECKPAEIATIKPKFEIDTTKLNSIIDVYTGATFRFNNLIFRGNTYQINDSVKPNLKLFAKMLIKQNLIVDFHDRTDSTATGPNYNWALFNARVQTICMYLISLGVDKKLLIWQPINYTKPIDKNSPREIPLKPRFIGFELIRFDNK